MINFPELKFDSRTHTYTVNGRKLASVTSRIANCFEPFDAERVIRRMREDEGKFEVGPYAGMTDSQIKRAWKQKGSNASKQGIKFHSVLENYMCGNLPLFPPGKEYEQVAQFLQDFDLRPNNNNQCEVRVYYGDLAGTIDFVQFHSSREVSIYDWKRSTKAFDNNSYGKRSTCSIDLPDSKFDRYQLQLNLYRLLLINNGYTVRHMYLVQFHPDIKNYTALEVEILHDIDQLL